MYSHFIKQIIWSYLYTGVPNNGKQDTYNNKNNIESLEQEQRAKLLFYSRSLFADISLFCLSFQ